MINKLNKILDNSDKKKLIYLIIFSLIISLVEVIGISAIMPFLSLAVDLTLVHSNQYYKELYDFLSFSSEVDFTMIFGILLIAFYIFRSLINLIYVYTINKFVQYQYYKISNTLFQNYMNLRYIDFTKQNSSIMTKTIAQEVTYTTSLINAFLQMISEILIVILIYSLMLYVDYKITLFLTLILVLNAILMLKTVSVGIKKAGLTRSLVQKRFYEIMNSSFGNFKLIKLSKENQKILDNFSDSSLSYCNANVANGTLTKIPRFFLEAIGFSIIISIILYLLHTSGENISNSLSIIAMFVMALYRLLPSINKIMTSYNVIVFHSKALDIVYNDFILKGEIFTNGKIDFKKEIILRNINFEYESKKLVLKNINLSINKGEKIAFVGESGSGKSTLVDIIIGLYTPLEGDVISDGKLINASNMKEWRAKIGYIPQSVYLFDGTVGQNVAFGLNYNKEKIDKVLKKAKIYDFLITKEGQNTFVGEGGIMLSGGQKQRIAIARALYIDPEILVLDEATSALDDDTEKEIMNEIYNISHDKTLIIIAHRLTTLNRCEHIYKIENGEIK